MKTEKLNSPQALRLLREKLIAQRKSNKTIVSICAGTGCLACGCQGVLNEFRKVLTESHLDAEVEIKATGCPGFCERGPLVVLQPWGLFYQKVKPADVRLIVDQTIKGGKYVNKLLYRDPLSKQIIPLEKDIPFYRKQMRLLIGRNGHIDPTSIADAIVLGAYDSAAKAIHDMQPEAIINEMKQSGLRGRGGGGFLTGRKWASARKAAGDPKYVICNADEGDPGAFMDRSLLEGNPHLVIEGMIIGAFAVGSHD